MVTAAAIADARTVAAAGRTPTDVRAALFAAAPLIVGDYVDASSSLALDWYEELRAAAKPRTRFSPSPLAVINEDAITSSVAWATSSLYDLGQDLSRLTDELLERARQESLALLEPILQKDVAAGFRDTIVGNADQDPSAVGWQRFARAGACKFCLMLAARGAVYTESSVDFAAHTNCHCVAGPSYDPSAPRASVIQYVASSRTRTPEQQAAVREYLNQNYPDAPG